MSTPETKRTALKMPGRVLEVLERRTRVLGEISREGPAVTAVRSGYQQRHRWSQATSWLRGYDPGETWRPINLPVDIIEAATDSDGIYDPYLITAWLVIGLGILDEHERDEGKLPAPERVRTRFDIIEEACQ